MPLGDGDHDRGHPCGAWPVNVGTVPQERPALVEVTGAEGREVFDTHTHTHTHFRIKLKQNWNEKTITNTHPRLIVECNSTSSRKETTVS